MSNEQNTPPKHRKQRCITATDNEWEEVIKQARIANMPISRYVIERLIHAPEIKENNVTDDVLPSSVQWQMAHDLRMMTMTMRQQFNTPEWQRYFTRIEENIDHDFDREMHLSNHG